MISKNLERKFGTLRQRKAEDTTKVIKNNTGSMMAQWYIHVEHQTQN